MKPATPITDTLEESDWSMPRGWKNRIHDHARKMESDRARLIEALRDLLDGGKPFAIKRANNLLRSLGEDKP